jgi:hypothetical protein
MKLKLFYEKHFDNTSSVSVQGPNDNFMFLFNCKNPALIPLVKRFKTTINKEINDFIKHNHKDKDFKCVKLSTKRSKLLQPTSHFSCASPSSPLFPSPSVPQKKKQKPNLKSNPKHNKKWLYAKY